MTAFATIDELASYLRVGIDPDDSFAALCLEGASQAIRDWCRQEFDYHEDDVIVLDGSGTDVLLLPELPVLDVSEVIESFDTDNPRTLLGPESGSSAEYDWDGRAGLLFKRRGQFVRYESQVSATFGMWPDRRHCIQVKYTHGYASDYDTTDVPASIKLITIAAAARAYAQDGATTESTGSYNVSYAGQPGELTEAERRVLSRYRVGRRK